MPHPRTVKCDPLFAFLVIVSFLVPGIVTASPNPSKQQGHLIPEQPTHKYPVGIKVLSSTEGVDFAPYCITLFNSVIRNFHPKIPESAAVGGRGAVVVQVRVQKDGSLAEKLVTIVSSSRRKELDAAALSAIRTAAPFGGLPKGYSGTYLDLQISFYYNNTPPAPEQKPRVVPIVATANQTV
jgi:TonB family protein